MFFKKLQGGALYLAVFLSILVALLLSLFILVSYYSSVDFEKFLIRERVQENARSALNICLSGGNLVNNQMTITDLYGRGTDSVCYRTGWWGGYQVAAIKAFQKNEQRTFNCLIGVALPKDTSLVMREISRPLSVAGATHLTGKCFVPKAGVKRATVEGQSFSGGELIDGVMLPAPAAIPGPDKSWMNYLGQLVKSPVEYNDSLADLALLSGDSVSNSFFSKTLCLYSPGILILSSGCISGNVKIVSDKKIIVEEGCRINDALLVAPKIEIRAGFSGTLQAVAGDSIKVEKDAVLSYPSSLVVYQIAGQKKTPGLVMQEKSSCKGSVVLLQDNSEKEKPCIHVAKDCSIEGIVYSQGTTNLQGSVRGMVITNAFLLVTPSAEYENHVLNAEIARDKLSGFFAGALVLNGNTRKRIAKWVN